MVCFSFVCVTKYTLYNAMSIPNNDEIMNKVVFVLKDINKDENLEDALANLDG